MVFGCMFVGINFVSFRSRISTIGQMSPLRKWTAPWLFNRWVGAFWTFRIQLAKKRMYNAAVLGNQATRTIELTKSAVI